MADCIGERQAHSLAAHDASIEATDFGLNGLPRSLRWPRSASSAEIVRRLKRPLSFLRASRFASATASGRADVALAPVDFRAGRDTLAPPCRSQFDDKGRLLELDGAEDLPHQDGGHHRPMLYLGPWPSVRRAWRCISSPALGDRAIRRHGRATRAALLAATWPPGQAAFRR
jgi:hypothetical protein